MSIHRTDFYCLDCGEFGYSHFLETTDNATFRCPLCGKTVNLAELVASYTTQRDHLYSNGYYLQSCLDKMSDLRPLPQAEAVPA